MSRDRLADSAAMAGLKVVTDACDEQGNIDVENLKAKAAEHSEQLAALTAGDGMKLGMLVIGLLRAIAGFGDDK